MYSYACHCCIQSERRKHLKQSDVSWYPVTDGQVDDIAGNQLACQKRLQLAIANAAIKTEINIVPNRAKVLYTIFHIDGV